MNIINRVRANLTYPFSRIIVQSLSLKQQFKSRNKPVTIHHEEDYNGQPIMLLALYEKGTLRQDIVRLLEVAKSQGIYVIAVNTLPLKYPESTKGLISCYIEKPNFGRDFSSYRTGFMHFYERGWERQCPRLLMVNDSIYFSTRGLENFIGDMIKSPLEVLGATENYEIEYHLGSFCIAMSANVLQTDQLRRYWKSYRLTDVRPAVIKRGEMKLSKTLKRCVSEPTKFGALYSSSWFLSKIKDDVFLQDLILQNSRTSPITGWPTLSVKSIASQLSGSVIARKNSTEGECDFNIETSLNELNSEAVITNREELKKFLLRNVDEPSDGFEREMKVAIASTATEIFMRGSQIHQNALILLETGLPIIKLDLLYRGMLNIKDLIILTEKLSATEANDVSLLLMERPYGGITLVGWKQAAFMRGLI